MRGGVFALAMLAGCASDTITPLELDGISAGDLEVVFLVVLDSSGRPTRDPKPGIEMELPAFEDLSDLEVGFAAVGVNARLMRSGEDGDFWGFEGVAADVRLLACDPPCNRLAPSGSGLRPKELDPTEVLSQRGVQVFGPTPIREGDPPIDPAVFVKHVTLGVPTDPAYCPASGVQVKSLGPYIDAPPPQCPDVNTDAKSVAALPDGRMVAFAGKSMTSCFYLLDENGRLDSGAPNNILPFCGAITTSFAVVPADPHPVVLFFDGSGQLFRLPIDADGFAPVTSTTTGRLETVRASYEASDLPGVGEPCLPEAGACDPDLGLKCRDIGFDPCEDTTPCDPPEHCKCLPEIQAVAAAPDGTILATGDRGLVLVGTLEDGLTQTTLRKHRESISPRDKFPDIDVVSVTPDPAAPFLAGSDVGEFILVDRRGQQVEYVTFQPAQSEKFGGLGARMNPEGGFELFGVGALDGGIYYRPAGSRDWIRADLQTFHPRMKDCASQTPGMSAEVGGFQVKLIDLLVDTDRLRSSFALIPNCTGLIRLQFDPEREPSYEAAEGSRAYRCYEPVLPLVGDELADANGGGELGAFESMVKTAGPSPRRFIFGRGHEVYEILGITEEPSQ